MPIFSSILFIINTVYNKSTGINTFMATDCSRAIVNIRDLPTVENITEGDLLIVETSDGGTSVIDFSNVLIPIENTTFEDTILGNTTNIALLSASVTTTTNDINQAIQAQNTQINTISADVIRSNTFATFSITPTEETTEATLLNSSNIQSAGVTFNASLSTLTLPFIENFANTFYCVNTTGKFGSEPVNVVVTNISTSSITLCACDLSGNSVPLERGWVRIIA